MNIQFKPMTESDIPQWLAWTEKPYVKDVWFISGYETREAIYQKVKGNGYTYPFILMIDDKAVGYIQGEDLYRLRLARSDIKGPFSQEEPGTFCIDIFIGEEEYLNKGYGTHLIKKFVEKLFKEFKAEKILIDPAASNKRAIRCYEKAGFSFLRKDWDGITECCILKIDKNKS